MVQAEPSKKQVGAWVDPLDKDDLEELAYRRRTTISALVRGLILDELSDARVSGELDTERHETAAET